MSKPQPHYLPYRLRRTKAALLAVSLTLAGVLLMMLNGWLSKLELGSWDWLHALPLGELGGTLFGAGLLGTLFEYTFRRDQEEAVAERFRRTIHDEAPALRDAVIEAFRFQRSDLERIATPRLLDDLAATSLGLRFGDPAFGREVYGDIKHQAIAAEERWYDARVAATLGIPRVRSTAPYPFLDLVVRWEYRVVPRHRFRKFAVVSDRARYEELVAQRGETSVWYKPPDAALPATEEASFSLAAFEIDGRTLPIRRSAIECGQIYTVDIGQKLIERQEPVVVSFTYRSRLSRHGHLIHFDIDRPVRGLDLRLNYQEAGIAQMMLIDHISSTHQARTSQLPDVPGAQTYTFSYDGWVLPRAGISFVWRLDEEDASAAAADDPPSEAEAGTTQRAA